MDGRKEGRREGRKEGERGQLRRIDSPPPSFLPSPVLLFHEPKRDKKDLPSSQSSAPPTAPDLLLYLQALESDLEPVRQRCELLLLDSRLDWTRHALVRAEERRVILPVSLDDRLILRTSAHPSRHLRSSSSERFRRRRSDHQRSSDGSWTLRRGRERLAHRRERNREEEEERAEGDEG